MRYDKPQLLRELVLISPTPTRSGFIVALPKKSYTLAETEVVKQLVEQQKLFGGLQVHTRTGKIFHYLLSEGEWLQSTWKTA
jgi:hypothetical protein